jgi:hypothetical protein
MPSEARAVHRFTADLRGAATLARMERRSNPSPAQLLAEVDRLIAERHHQDGELKKLRRLLMAQVWLFEKVGRRESDRPAETPAPPKRRRAAR